MAARIVNEAIREIPGAEHKLHTQVDVRWADLDADDNLDHAHLVTMLAEARDRWLFAVSAPTSTLASGCVVVDLQVTYRRRLRLGDGPLGVTMCIRQVRACDFIIDYEVRPHGAVSDVPIAASASVRHAAFVSRTGNPRRLSSVEREYLRHWMQ